MEIDIDFEGMEPKNFVLESRIDFLHKIKSYASIINLSDGMSEKLRKSKQFMTDINNYRIALHSALGKMPDSKSEGLLLILLANIDLAYSERTRVSEDMIFLADNMANSYLNLTDYLEKR